MNAIFSESFCVRFNIPADKFVEEVFNRSLYPHARFLKWLLIFYDAYYFTSDYDLIMSVGTIRRMRDFTVEAIRFNVHPTNRGFLRRKWMLRISTKRLRFIVTETLKLEKSKLGQTERNFSAVPFAKPVLDSANLMPRHATGVYNHRTGQT